MSKLLWYIYVYHMYDTIWYGTNIDCFIIFVQNFDENVNEKLNLTLTCQALESRAR